MTTGSGQTKYPHARTYSTRHSLQPTSQHVQLTYRHAFSHVTSAWHTTKPTIVWRHQRRMPSVAVRTLTLPVQTVRTSAFPVQCKQRPRDRPIPPSRQSYQKEAEEDRRWRCDELSGWRRRRRRTTTRRREKRERENQHQEGEEVMNARV